MGKNLSSDFKKERVQMHLQQNEEREKERPEDCAALLLNVSPNLLEGLGSRDLVQARAWRGFGRFWHEEEEGFWE